MKIDTDSTKYDFEILHIGVNMTDEEQNKMRDFLLWYSKLQDAIRSPIAELSRFGKISDLVTAMLEESCVFAAVSARRSKIKDIIDSMPEFPYTWPDHLDPFDALLTIARIAQSVR